MIQRISIILIILVMLAVPAAAGTAAFSLFVYFENFRDQPPDPGKPSGQATSLSCSDIPEPVRTYISNMAQYTGLPAAFIASIAKTESGFKNPTTNLNIAWGIMQLSHYPYLVWQEQDALYRNDYDKNFSGFKTSTKIQPPSQVKPTPRTGKITVDPFLEEYNIFIGSKYLWWLRGHYQAAAGKDDVKLFSYIAAAYNGGWPAYDNAKYNLKQMDQETIDYVPKVITAYQDYKARCQKDLTPIAAAKNSPGKVQLNIPVYSQGPRSCAGTSVDMISDYLKQKNGQPPKGSMKTCYVSPLATLNSSTYAGKFTTYVDSGAGNTLDQATYFNRIQTSLDKGFPVIQGVDVYHSSVGTASTNSHYWVISGYDTTGTTPTYSITDPATGQTYTENQDFVWKHNNNPAASGQVLFYVP